MEQKFGLSIKDGNWEIKAIKGKDYLSNNIFAGEKLLIVQVGKLNSIGVL